MFSYIKSFFGSADKANCAPAPVAAPTPVAAPAPAAAPALADAAPSPADSFARHVDLLLVTAKDTERDALLEHLRSAHATEPTRESTLAIESWAFTHGELSCALVSGTRQGPEPAAVFTVRALHAFRPLAAVMVGICAGNPEKLKRKDDSSVLVACAKKVLFIGDGKNTPSGVLSETDMLQLSEPAQRAVIAAAGKINRDGSHTVVEHGVMLTSTMVEEDFAARFKAFTDMDRNVVALDMESSAFVRACNDSAHGDVPTVCLGVIKGVVDFASVSSRTVKDEHTPVAIQRAFKVAVAAANSLLIPAALASPPGPVARQGAL